MYKVVTRWTIRLLQGGQHILAEVYTRWTTSFSRGIYNVTTFLANETRIHRFVNCQNTNIKRATLRYHTLTEHRSSALQGGQGRIVVKTRLEQLCGWTMLLREHLHFVFEADIKYAVLCSMCAQRGFQCLHSAVFASEGCYTIAVHAPYS